MEFLFETIKFCVLIVCFWTFVESLCFDNRVSWWKKYYIEIMNMSEEDAHEKADDYARRITFSRI